MSELEFELGLEHEMNFEVLEEHTASHLGSGSVAVLSTPTMILFMEQAARILMQNVLPEPYSTVGTKVNISHNQAISIGKTVTSYAKLIERDRKKLIFEVKVMHKGKIVGKGIHDRFIIDENKFLQSVV